MPSKMMDVRAARIVLTALDTRDILIVLPSKNLPRARKDGRGMTKGKKQPWDLPGGKLEIGETSTVAATRELLEETGLHLESLGATLVTGPEFDHLSKTDVFLYTVPKEVEATPGEGISECEWCSRGDAQTKGGFALQKALALMTEALS